MHPSSLLCSPLMVEVAPHSRHQCVALNSTYMYVINGALSKMMSFLHFQMDQHNVVAPTNNCFLCFRPNTSNQSVNIELILVGPCMLKVTYNALHRNLA
jgi:hypothetical protein